MAAFSYRGRPMSAHHLERSSASHSSMDDSFEDKLELPASFKRDHLDDLHATSKFSKAMKNPDWRQRGEDSTSFTSSGSGPEMSEYNKIKHQMDAEESQCKFFPPSHRHLANMASWNDFASTQKSATESSRVDEQSKDILTAPAETMMGLRGGWSLCNIVSQKQLSCPGGDGKGMSIIEIAPSTQGDLLDFGHESRGISFADPANILRVHDQNRRFFKTPPKMTRNEQERALATIMTEARKTPPRLRIIRPDCISWNQARREDSSESVCSDRTRGYLMTGSRAPIQKIQAESEVQNTPSATVQSCHDNPDLQKKHTAFQKMLQKLQRKNPQAPQVSQVHQVSQVSRKGFDAQSRQFKERSCISMPERQAHGNGSSDSGIGLYPNTNKREKQDSTDSGISIGSSAKQLNPRAREFLTRDQVTSLINEKLDKVNGRSVPAKASIGLVLPHKSIPAVPEKREAFEGKTASPSAFRGTASSNVSHSPFDRLFGFAPPSNLGFHANGPPLGPTVPSIIPQSGLGLNVESLATFGGAGGQGNLSNAKPAPPILNMSMTTALPFMNNFPVPLVMPTSSWGSVEGPRPLLCPVPKPRKPDTQDQQAYEAWIEWRKATEPGYAMECKNRQQRRTRRIQGAGFHSHVHAPAQTAS